MTRSGTIWMVGAAFLGTMAYALAEEVILTTYYPSPRGVYKELRVTDKIGVGTTAPGEEITVAASDGSTALSLSTPGTGSTHQTIVNWATKEADSDGVFESGEKGWHVTGRGDAFTTVAERNDLLFWKWDSAWSGPHLTLDGPTGNVGIGTTGPANKLHVLGSGTGTDMARIRVASSDNQAGIAFLSDDTGETVVYSPDGTDDLRFYAGGTDRMTVLSGGNVGIGTTPGVKLDVNGQMRTTETVYVGDGFAPDETANLFVEDSLYVTNSGTFIDANSYKAQGQLGLVKDCSVDAALGGIKVHVGLVVVDAVNCLVVPSDARLKTNVTPLTSVLERVDQIRGVSFEWNELAGSYGWYGIQAGQQELGLIAQEVEVVFPELVNEVEGIKKVEYDRFTAVLVEAIKELHKAIEELRADNEQLKLSIQELATQMKESRGTFSRKF